MGQKTLKTLILFIIAKSAIHISKLKNVNRCIFC